MSVVIGVQKWELPQCNGALVHAHQTEWATRTFVTRQYRFSGHGLGASWPRLEEKTVAEDPGLVPNPSLEAM
jgi:hypothetical protein